MLARKITSFMSTITWIDKSNPQPEKTDNDADYTICLLLGCIDALATELAVRDQIVPEYIVTRYLLEQALNIRDQSTAKISAILELDYGWLTDYLESLIIQ